MIGRLKGTLISNQPPELLVDVGGVGYEVQCPLSTVFALPAVGQEVTLITHLSVREDAHVLFGFATSKERVLFRALIKISGVGPKLALAILSGMETDRFLLSIQDQDPATLVKIPGVGKKTAERLIVEMKDKLSAIGSDGPLLSSSAPSGFGAIEQDAKQDAESALISLGYKPAQAQKAIEKVAVDGQTSEAIIRAALRQI